MPLNTYELQKKITEDLGSLSVKHFKSELIDPSSKKNPIMDVRVYLNDKYGSFNVTYVYPRTSNFHKDALKCLKKTKPNANRIMTFCQGMFDVSGLIVRTNCRVTDEDGSFITTLPENLHNKFNTFQDEIKNAIESNIQTNYKTLQPEIVRLVRRLVK